LLLNFGAATLKEGLHRIVNKLSPADSPQLRINLPTTPAQSSPPKKDHIL